MMQWAIANVGSTDDNIRSIQYIRTIYLLIFKEIPTSNIPVKELDLFLNILGDNRFTVLDTKSKKNQSTDCKIKFALVFQLKVQR